jgi:hypothetical protein
VRTITVIETSIIKSGQSSTGKPWTLYSVTAVDEGGEPIDEKLVSFDDLKGTVQVDVAKKDDPKYGVSYTLKLAGGSPGSNPPPAGARLGPKVDGHEERIAQLETDVAFLKEVVAQLGKTDAIATTSLPQSPATGGATF